MDLREKFIEDLFNVMHDGDKGTPTFKQMNSESQDRARWIAEGMIRKGWFYLPEKGVK